MRALLTLVLLLPLSTPLALADPHGDCDSKGYPALGIVDIGGIAYVDDRNYLLGNGIWIYVESNGEPGLQRGGGGNTFPDSGDPCMDDSEAGPDQLLF